MGEAVNAAINGSGLTQVGFDDAAWFRDQVALRAGQALRGQCAQLTLAGLSYGCHDFSSLDRRFGFEKRLFRTPQPDGDAAGIGLAP